MMYIAENLKALRKSRDLTQEEAAEMLGVSAQSVSKWERGDTFPDITMLPALANLYKVSVDALIGMDKINDTQTRTAIFTAGHDHLRSGDIDAAIVLYSEALKTFPNDEGIVSDFAMALALDGDPTKLAQAATLCERVLASGQGEKVHHTTRAALCFIYLKAGEKSKAVAVAQKLPHIRESRETVLEQLEKEPTADDINAYLRFIAIGENDEQDIITVDFGRCMSSMCTEYDLLGQLNTLRNEFGAPSTKAGYRILPQVRIRDNYALRPNRVRVRHYADYLVDSDFTNPVDAGTAVIKALRKIAQANITKTAR